MTPATRLRALFAGAVLAVLAARAAPAAPPLPVATVPVAQPAPAAHSAAQSAPQAQADPWSFLEDAQSPATGAFFASEAARTRTALDRIAGRAELAARIRVLSEGATAIHDLAIVGKRVFYLRLAPAQDSAALCVREGFAGAERVLVDPARLAKVASPGAGARAASSAGPWSIDWFVASPDARHVAYGVSRGGSGDSVLHVVATDTGRDLGFEIDRARFNAGLAWMPDGRSFFYARVPAGNAGAARDENVRVYRHQLGRDTRHDEVVFASGVGGARDVPAVGYPSLVVPADSRYAYAVVREGMREELAVHVTPQKDLRSGRPHWRKIVGVEDQVVAIEPWKDDLYLLSGHNAPHRRVLRVKGGAGLAVARLVVPEGDSVIRAMALARDALYLRTMVAGVDRLERVPIGLLGMKPPEFMRIPFDVAIAQLIADPRRPGAVLRLDGWIQPPAIVEVDARSGDLRNTELQPAPLADYSGMDEVRLYAPAADGTKIPVTLLYRRTTRLTGDNPTLLAGFGAYGVTVDPSFDPARLAWLERGGVFAVAHLRGGGEYGEAWHAAGRNAAKPNTVMDLVAVSEFLIHYGFTSPKRLAIEGSGAGGIAVAGAMVRRPDLYAAVVARSPLVDMLDYEAAPGEPANVAEFGSIRTPEGRAALGAISAYQQVADGTRYPALLATAAMNDPQVPPWQPARMVARVRGASASGKPVLLRVAYDAGNGPGDSRTQHDEELTDIYTFLLWQMGDAAFQPPVPPPPVPTSPPPAAAPAPATPPAKAD
jgi:prolyl oligopeptidase